MVLPAGVEERRGDRMLAGVCGGQWCRVDGFKP
jgi:hypothetical protein